MYHYFLNQKEDTFKFAEKIANILVKGGSLLLYGDLGVGKTTLTQSVACFLNIKSKIKSPTYALMQEYSLEKGTRFYHLDLYRLHEIEEVLSIGYEEIIDNPHNIVIVEWSERIPENYKPKKRIDLKIEVEADGRRKMELNFVRENILTKELIEALLNEFQTPQNVRKHCELVAKVAISLGKKLIQKNELVDLNLIYEASMLHDLMRLVDFNELKREKFEEKVDDQKWQIWQNLRQKYQGVSHAKAAQEILLERGYAEVAAIIRKHCTSCILQRKREEELITWEDKLLYYADKRVKNDKIVSLDERFRIGRAQNGHLIKSLAESVEIEAKANDLENEIFELIGEKKEEYSFED